MTVSSTKPEAEAIIGALEKHLPKPMPVEVKRGDQDNVALLLVPSADGGYEFLDPKPALDAYRKFPERREGTARLTTLASFIAHVNRSKDSQSAIFLDDTGTAPKFIAVFDYHLAANVDDEVEKLALAAGKPAAGSGLTLTQPPPNMRDLVAVDADPKSFARNLKHRAEYAFPLSKEWEAWTAASKSFTDPATFAAWIEDRLLDVLEPAAVPEKTAKLAAELGINLVGKHRLMELSKGIAINVDRKVVNRVNLSTGETEFVFEEKHSDKDGVSKVNAPGGFAISIPVLRGGDHFTVLVRFRYNVRDHKVVYNVAPHNLERVFETVIAEAETKVATDTALPVFRGQPEGGAR